MSVFFHHNIMAHVYSTVVAILYGASR